MNPDFENLAALLRERIAVIADHAFRDRDPDAHLEKLKTVSEAIMAEQAELAGKIPFRLGHFLENCSYDKALAFIESPESTKC
ncbi:MAG: hypothetical protein AAGA58_05070 [Verrucomicrobiota bacterium]